MSRIDLADQLANYPDDYDDQSHIPAGMLWCEDCDRWRTVVGSQPVTGEDPDLGPLVWRSPELDCGHVAYISEI